MKNLKKTFLPDTILNAGKLYKVNVNLTALARDNKTDFNHTIAYLKNSKTKIIRLAVLSKNLKGKTDLHGKNYEPSIWYFTTEIK